MIPKPEVFLTRSDLERQRNCVLNFVGEITVAAPREAVFKALSDAPFFASCIEGVRDLTAIDATHYDAVLETRIAYMRFNFKVGVLLSRVTPSEEIEAKVEGTPMGMVGRLTATATTRLADADGGTVIRYSVDATLTGKLGSMGQPVLKAKAKEMEKQFSARLAAAFAGEQPGSPP
jgi:carbon monoxide dehydrogenase subunit G